MEVDCELRFGAAGIHNSNYLYSSTDLALIGRLTLSAEPQILNYLFHSLNQFHTRWL